MQPTELLAFATQQQCSLFHESALKPLLPASSIMHTCQDPLLYARSVTWPACQICVPSCLSVHAAEASDAYSDGSSPHKSIMSDDVECLVSPLMKTARVGNCQVTPPPHLLPQVSGHLMFSHWSPACHLKCIHASCSATTCPTSVLRTC